MRRKIFILAIVTLIFNSCDNNHEKYKALQMRFYPSFITNSTFNLDMNKWECEFIIDKGVISLDKNEIIEIDETKKYWIEIEPNERQDLYNLTDKITELDDLDGIGRDGLTIFFDIITNMNDTITKTAWSPRKGTAEYDLITKVQYISYEIHEQELYIYFNELEKYKRSTTNK